MDWQVSVVVAAVIFGLYVLYKFRPILGERGAGSGRAELRDARARLTKATTDAERLDALLAAGDACARTVGLGGGASAYYFRAMRLAPTSDQVVEHVAQGLARRPRILETLLWRRLGAEPWTGESTNATRAVLRQLIAIYTTKRRSALRARAMENALSAIEANDAKSAEKQADREQLSAAGALKH